MTVAELSTVEGEEAPGFFGPRWRGPGRGAPPAVLWAVLLAGVIAAASLPLDRVGVGWLVTGLGMALAVRFAVLFTRSERKVTLAGAVRLIWGLAALALLAVGVVRSAGWLFVLCLLAAIVCGTLAVVGGRTVAGIVGGLVIQPIAAARALPWLARGAATVKRGPSVARLAVVVLVTLVLLIVFGSLFAAADPAFAELTQDLVPSVADPFRWAFLFVVVGLGTLAATYLVLAPPNIDFAASGPRRTVHRLEWSLPLIVLDLLFAAFVAVQVQVLFGGSDHVLRTVDLTYAEYARRGFWQLLVVTLLTLAVLAAAARWAPRASTSDRVLIRVLLGLLAALTLVIVASALYRMDVYEEAYGYTRLRVFVSTVELGLGVVYVLILAAGVRLRAAWLPQAVVGVGVALLLGLAVLNPDRFIADRNVDRYEAGKRIDYAYLRNLSADAVPALDRLPADVRPCALRAIHRDLFTQRDGWQGWNLAREDARRLLISRPVATACPPTISD